MCVITFAALNRSMGGREESAGKKRTAGRHIFRQVINLHAICLFEYYSDMRLDARTWRVGVVVVAQTRWNLEITSTHQPAQSGVL